MWLSQSPCGDRNRINPLEFCNYSGLQIALKQETLFRFQLSYSLLPNRVLKYL